MKYKFYSTPFISHSSIGTHNVTWVISSGFLAEKYEDLGAHLRACSVRGDAYAHVRPEELTWRCISLCARPHINTSKFSYLTPSIESVGVYSDTLIFNDELNLLQDIYNVAQVLEEFYNIFGPELKVNYLMALIDLIIMCIR